MLENSYGKFYKSFIIVFVGHFLYSSWLTKLKCIEVKFENDVNVHNPSNFDF